MTFSRYLRFTKQQRDHYNKTLRKIVIGTDYFPATLILFLCLEKHFSSMLLVKLDILGILLHSTRNCVS